MKDVFGFKYHERFTSFFVHLWRCKRLLSMPWGCMFGIEMRRSPNRFQLCSSHDLVSRTQEGFCLKETASLCPLEDAVRAVPWKLINWLVSSVFLSHSPDERQRSVLPGALMRPTQRSGNCKESPCDSRCLLIGWNTRVPNSARNPLAHEGSRQNNRCACSRAPERMQERAEKCTKCSIEVHRAPAPEENPRKNLQP